MYVIRETLHCRPGKVRDLLSRFQTLSAILQRMGYRPFRLLTDASGQRFWTLIAEVEAPGFNEFLEIERTMTADPEAQKAMSGYHELVEWGRREIYRIEA